ncbi:MAG TPA: TlpA disulfide reductase family protein [Pyrinomonadaceae bacterium]|nr:TlpA disulfide reductase family protein [Pyrinomonadaceae bacterium]
MIQRRSKAILFFAAAVLFASALSCAAQLKSDEPDSAPSPVRKVPKTIFRDSDGNLVTNNEFVDIRMANFHIPDRTIVSTLEDGTIEFRLQKVPQEGAAAPDFSAKFVDGTPANFADLRGKVIVLNFWFIGCPACRAETPKLNEFAARFAGDPNVEFIAITYDAASAVKKYTAANRFDYKLIGDAQDTLDKFVVGGYPKNIVIGKDGRIVYWRSTIRAWDKFDSVVRAELAK